MFTDSHEALFLAHDRGRQLRDQAAAERLFRNPSAMRRALAASLRRAADRLDPAALKPQLPASR